MHPFIAIKEFRDTSWSKPCYLWVIDGPVRVGGATYNTSYGIESIRRDVDFYNNLLDLGAQGVEQRFEPVLLVDTTRYGTPERPCKSWGLRGPVPIVMTYIESIKPDSHCKMLNDILDYGKSQA